VGYNSLIKQVQYILLLVPLALDLSCSYLILDSRRFWTPYSLLVSTQYQCANAFLCRTHNSNCQPEFDVEPDTSGSCKIWNVCKTFLNSTYCIIDLQFAHRVLIKFVSLFTWTNFQIIARQEKWEPLRFADSKVMGSHLFIILIRY
jgi:hypothetical protein